MESILGQKIMGKGGEVATSTFTSAPVTMLYFSAHWCPPCRSFTPKLAQFYEQVNQTGKKLEIVYVSMDRTESDFNDYYGGMPWLAIPYDGQREAVSSRYGVNSIPTLALIKKDGTVIEQNCRGAVEGTGPSVYDEWLERSR